MSRNNKNDPTPYAVRCQGSCVDLQFLTEKQYEKQLKRDDCEWRCPTCKDLAVWDDDCADMVQRRGEVTALKRVA